VGAPDPGVSDEPDADASPDASAALADAPAVPADADAATDERARHEDAIRDINAAYSELRTRKGK